VFLQQAFRRLSALPSVSVQPTALLVKSLFFVLNEFTISNSDNVLPKGMFNYAHIRNILVYLGSQSRVKGPLLRLY